MGGHDHPTTKLTLTPDYASVQRFVIPAADGFRGLILTARTNEVEHVFALIEYVDCMSERICLTNSLYN